MAQKGFVPIIFILIILVVSGLIIGGSFFIKNKYPQFLGNSAKQVYQTISTPNSGNLNKSLIIKEQASLLATMPTEKPLWVVFSPDGQKVAYPGSLVINGQSLSVDNAPFFSPDGKQYAYFVTTGPYDQGYMMVNGKKEKDCKFSSYRTFSKDSKHFAYQCGSIDAKHPGEAAIVVDGVEQQRYAGGTIGDIYFTDDGRVVYKAQKENNKQVVVVGDKEGKENEYVSGIKAVIGNTVYYLIADHQSTYDQLIIGDQEQNKVNRINEGPVVSADGKSFAYIAIDSNNKYSVIFNGKRIELPNSNGTSSAFAEDLMISSDGKHVAFAVTSTVKDDGDNKAFRSEAYIVKDEKPLRKDNQIVYRPVFSPDSDNIAYIAFKAKNPPGPKSDVFVVLDEKESKAYDFATNHIFSEDGKHFAYLASSQKTDFVVVDGTEDKHYSSIGTLYISAKLETDRGLRFLPKSSVVSYIANTTNFDDPNNKQFVVIGNKESSLYDEIYERPILSPDGKKVSFGARKGKDLYWVDINISN